MGKTTSPYFKAVEDGNPYRSKPKPTKADVLMLLGEGGCYCKQADIRRVISETRLSIKEKEKLWDMTETKSWESC